MIEPAVAISTTATKGRMPPRPALLRLCLRIFIGAVLVILLARAFGGEEWKRAVALVGQAGWPLILVLMGTPLALACDALGWRQILRGLANLGNGELPGNPGSGTTAGTRGTAGTPGNLLPGFVVASLSTLTRIRIISEAALLALPGGSVIAEATKLGLLTRATGVRASTAAASLVVARALHIAAAAGYLGLVAVIVWTLPEGALSGKRSAVLLIALTASLFTALAAHFAFLLLRDARPLARLADLLERLSWRRLSQLVAKHRRHLDDVDEQTRRYSLSPRAARMWSGLPFLAQWLVEGAETILLLTLLQANVGWRGALILDAMTSFVRAVVIVVPAGLGVQEITQVVMLRLLGARDHAATAAALICIKRMKELFWIVTGALLAAATSGSWRSMVTTPIRTRQ